MAHVFKRKLTGQYSTLSSKLKKAVDFVNTKPIDGALITFTRMAKSLAHDSYAMLREKMRNAVVKKPSTLSYSLVHLQKSHLSWLEY